MVLSLSLCVWIYGCACVYECVYLPVCMCFHVCVYMCMCVYVYVCVCVSLCVCLCVCVCVLSKCSGQCGEGRMTRYVVCQTASGSSISEDQFDHDLRPLAVQPCGDRNCPAHWVEIGRAHV